MAGRRLTTVEAAARLGVKPATLYAYVSRGQLQRERTAGGSTFDAQEVERLAETTRRAVSSRGGREMAFVTELTLIEGGRLRYRGEDAVGLSRSRSFEEVATWLWSATWPGEGEPGRLVWRAPAALVEVAARAGAALAPGCLPIDRFKVAVAAAACADELRYDLSPHAVAITARGLIATVVESLPPVAPLPASDADASLAPRLWPRLSPLRPTPARLHLLDAALVLVADHELAASTLAARVAAAFRADPYAVVSTGLGPASGAWHAGAANEVEALFSQALAEGPDRAIGSRIRLGGTAPGFGMRLYPEGDPRGAELLDRLADQRGRDGVDAERFDVVARTLAVSRQRGFLPPNVDLGLGALAFCGRMIPGAGQAIATIGRMAGWIAHALEEYASATTFRVRANYVGVRS